MSAPRRSLGIAAIAAVITLEWLAGSATAGPISAGSVAGGPPMLGTLTPGMPVSDANLVKTQYRSVGLDASLFSNLSLAALGSIGGTTAFVPTSATTSGFNLDYGSFVGFQVVNPTTGAASTTHHLSVEFVGPRASQGFLYALTPNGGILGSTAADDGVGPHGGMLATLDFNGIGVFAAWSLGDGAQTQIAANQAWGIAMIDISGDSPPSGGNSPEPATLALACGGLVGALGAAWKRRRAASR
jgi:hypothetical protein